MPRNRKTARHNKSKNPDLDFRNKKIRKTSWEGLLFEQPVIEPFQLPSRNPKLAFIFGMLIFSSHIAGVFARTSQDIKSKHVDKRDATRVKTAIDPSVTGIETVKDCQIN